METEEKDHRTAPGGPQKGVKIRKNPSEIIKFRLSWEVYSRYKEESEKAEIGSVALYCKRICEELWPAVREERIKWAMDHYRASARLKFTKEEMAEAQRRLLAE